ncbi:hypothetical protein DFH28DRAFT_1091835 [Melampsora americana]|nr:hypothetical protein DFH28DRAFT_1091835 [Melampsora americana]
MNLPFAKEVQQIYRSNKHKPKSEQTSQLDIIRHCAHLEGKFGEHMFNPFLRLAAFDGHLDTPVETLHVVLLGVTKYLYRDVVSRLSPNELDNLVGRWQGFKIDGLNAPPIQARNMVHHAQSLLGKDFRIVLQAAPFVFFEFLPDEYRHCWILLVHLASLVFQTRIFNMGVYLSELKIVVARFLKQLVALNAQWTNKPKFHMLTHLPYCVERFGPPSLFATEKMESQNGVTRIASVHSNRHSPGKDIANRFNDERLLRMLISGSSFYNRQIRTRATASSLLRNLFQEKEIRRGLGLNQLGTYSSDMKPQITYSPNVVDCDDPPRELARKWPNVQWQKVLQVGLENGQKVLKGTFVLVDFKKEAGAPICVGQVGGIWEQVGSKTVLVQVRKCRLAPGLEPFYGMKEIKVSSAEAWVRTQRTESQKKHAEVTHKDTNSFIINAGAHYYSEFHRNVTAAVWDPVTAAEWKDSIQEGLSVWYQCCPPKDHEMNAEDVGQPQDDDPLNINIATTSNSPNTTPAPAFRPPQPRNTPASATSRPSGSRACVTKFADLLKLTKDNQNVLQKVIDNTLPGEEYISTLSYLAFVCQESKGGSPTTLKWVPSRAIREAFRDQVGEFILRADLQAYSKTVAEDCTTMVQSLEVLTFNYLKELKADFLEEHGPGDYLAGEACIPGTTMYLFVKETLKNQRSKVHTALLTKILGVAEDAIVKVPAGKSMVLQVARTFLPKLRALPDNDALRKLGRAKLKRMIFMRYVTAYYYLNQTENKKRCQWTLMDEALAELRTRPESDATLYFDRVARYDRETFTGKVSWATIKASGPLPAPFVEQVLARGEDRNAFPGESGYGNGGNGSGDQVMEEGLEEEE